MIVQVYIGEGLASYGFGKDHPFGLDRLGAFREELVRRGLDTRVRIAEPVMCSERDLLRFHTADYVQRVKRLSETGEGYLDDGDTPAFKGMYEAASYVVGSGLDGLARSIFGGCPRVFVPIAGLHHASRDSAAGFCVFNDVGVLIETLRQEHGIQRIAYVDIDAHHGDGVFYAFEDDENLIFADIHEDGRVIYPGTGFVHETGTGRAKGTKLNIPLPPGANDESFHRVWPKLEEFVRAGKPEIILLQAGADSIKGDPITDMEFTPQVHAHVASRLCAVADEFCSGRILVMGGGGYNRTNLGMTWCAVVESMLEAE